MAGPARSRLMIRTWEWAAQYDADEALQERYDQLYCESVEALEAAARWLRVPPHHQVTTWPSLIRVFDVYVTSGEDPQWYRRYYPRLRSLRAARSIREQLVKVIRGPGSCYHSNSDLPGRVHRGGGSSGIDGGRRATQRRYDMTARTMAIAVMNGGDGDNDDE
ncbi:hypothetical protein HK405_011284, partial [Cladochytrium tenue]